LNLSSHIKIKKFKTKKLKKNINCSWMDSGWHGSVNVPPIMRTAPLCYGYDIAFYC